MTEDNSTSGADYVPPEGDDESVEHNSSAQDTSGQGAGGNQSEVAGGSPPQGAGDNPQGQAGGSPPQGTGGNGGSGNRGLGPPLEDNPIQEEIDRVNEELKGAQKEKEEADSAFADLDGRLSALLKLQGDLEKAAPAYASAHDQLTIDQQAYLDYYESEDESLTELLGPEAVATVTKMSADKEQADVDAEIAVDDCKKNLDRAVRRRDKADTRRKDKQNRVTELKGLVATIRGRHAKLKSMRDEVTKAHQAGQYALAFWLLECREYDPVLKAEPKLIDPSELPAALLAAVKALAKAEKVYADKEITLAKRRAALAKAEGKLADQKSKGEVRLRNALMQMPPTKA